MTRPGRLLAAAAGLLLVLTGCSAPTGTDRPPAEVGETTEAATTAGATRPGEPARTRPLQPGERRRTLAMPTAYTPSAPTGTGADDYRCFLLDPGLGRDAWLTGTHVLPGNPDVVHHVILFRVGPEQVAEAERVDAGDPGPGWTCFGGTGLSGELTDLDDAPWLGAWAPGGAETLTPEGYGVDLPRGSQIVMQVHYHLRAGAAADVSATRIRTVPRARDLTGLHTFLLPAPVELPCRPGRDAGPLCDREAAVADVRARFGAGPGSAADLLHLLCGTRPTPSSTTSCTREVRRPMTVLAAAGHMHLLGRRIRIVTNPRTPQARTVLDVAPWDFDDQGSRPVQAVRLRPGDRVEVSCTHRQWLRDVLPAFEDQQERYVVWGDGTTDEMCLGLLSVALG